MALPYVIPIAEAATFTIGCAVLNARKFDPERVGVALMLLLAALVFALIIVATAKGVIDVAGSVPEASLSRLE